MRILFYISTIRGGGAARVMINVANGLSKKDHVVLFVTNFPADLEYELESSIRRYNLETTENKGNTFSKNRTRIKVLRSIIAEERPDVAVSFMRENNFRLLISSKGLDVRTIVSVRNDPAKEYSSAVSKKLADILYKKADGIVFQTEDAKAAFPEEIQKKSVILFNQVDNRFFRKSKELGEYFVACGRLSRQKNYQMMIKAFAKLLEKHPDEVLRIYGEGPLKGELEDLVRELGIEGSVKFMGFSIDMPEVYNHSKLLVLTSAYEGMPNTMLEALASSVPVISTDCPCGGPRMVIKNGINGYLVPVDDIDYLAKVWISLTDSDITNMKPEAYNTALAFAEDKVLNDWERYISLIAANSEESDDGRKDSV